jgi:hypothetical protein
MEAALSQLGGERVTLRRRATRQCKQHVAAPEIVKRIYADANHHSRRRQWSPPKGHTDGVHSLRLWCMAHALTGR